MAVDKASSHPQKSSGSAPAEIERRLACRRGEVLTTSLVVFLLFRLDICASYLRKKKDGEASSSTE